MKIHKNIAHIKWECKCHIVWVHQYRWTVLYGKVRKRLGEGWPLIRELWILDKQEILFFIEMGFKKTYNIKEVFPKIEKLDG